MASNDATARVLWTALLPVSVAQVEHAFHQSVSIALHVICTVSSIPSVPIILDSQTNAFFLRQTHQIQHSHICINHIHRDRFLFENAEKRQHRDHHAAAFVFCGCSLLPVEFKSHQTNWLNVCECNQRKDRRTSQWSYTYLRPAAIR